MAKPNEEIAGLPLMENGVDFNEVFSVAKAAQFLGTTRKTVYDAILSNRLTAYTAPNMGSTQPETVVKKSDLLNFQATLRPNIRRATNATRPGSGRPRRAKDSEGEQEGEGK